MKLVSSLSLPNCKIMRMVVARFSADFEVSVKNIIYRCYAYSLVSGYTEITQLPRPETNNCLTHSAIRFRGKPRHRGMPRHPIGILARYQGIPRYRGMVRHIKNTHTAQTHTHTHTLTHSHTPCAAFKWQDLPDETHNWNQELGGGNMKTTRGTNSHKCVYCGVRRPQC